MFCWLSGFAGCLVFVGNSPFDVSLWDWYNTEIWGFLRFCGNCWCSGVPLGCFLGLGVFCVWCFVVFLGISLWNWCMVIVFSGSFWFTLGFPRFWVLLEFGFLCFGFSGVLGGFLIVFVGLWLLGFVAYL